MATVSFPSSGNLIEGTNGADLLVGTSEDETILGYGGDDTLSGCTGEDSFDGGGGSDTVDYSYSWQDRLRVDLSQDRAWFVDDPTSPVGPGNVAGTTEVLTSIEDIIGTRGNNVLIGDANDNVLSGHLGQDTFDGGDGSDTVDYSYSFQDRLRVDLAEGRAWFVDDPTQEVDDVTNPATTTEELISIENVIGTRGDNVLIGDGSDNVLDGGDGDDTLEGGRGSDTLDGGSGNDILTGGTNGDVIVFSNGYDRDTVIELENAVAPPASK